jgi:hypothetical protein
MSGVTEILTAIERGDFCAAESLLPLVYDEPRRLASYKLSHERPGQTLQEILSNVVDEIGWS